MVAAVEEDEFGIFREVRDAVVVGREVPGVGEPADVRPEEAVPGGRVFVLFTVGMLVMMPVGGGPPQGSPLHRGISEEGGTNWVGREVLKLRWEKYRW